MYKNEKTVSNFIAHILCIVLCLMGWSISVRADTHAESAFYFAEKRDWNNAWQHARASDEKQLLALITWLAILDGAYDDLPQNIAEFMQKKSHWPDAKSLQIRFEQSYANSGTATNKDTLAWFKKYPPITGAGKWMQAKAMQKNIGDDKQIAALIQDAWINGDFAPNTEQDIATNAKTILTQTIHEQRANRLVWEEKYNAAKRMQPLVSKAFTQMIDARIALETQDKKAPALVAKVPAAYRNSEGLNYSRMVWRHRKNDTSGVMEMLLKAPKKSAFAEQWWDYRETYIRRALDKRNIALASKLLHAHGLEKGVNFAEAAWLKGWISLEYEKKPEDAYIEFDSLYRGVNFAVSKARAAYWAGRAAEKMAEKEAAISWFKTAASFPTTFYGQLAFAQIYPNQPLRIQASSDIKPSAYNDFKKTDIAQALRLCITYDRLDIAKRFIKGAIDNANNPEQMLYIAMLAKEMHGDSLGVKAAKRALRYNVLLNDVAYPKLAKTHAGLEAALTHAITRQESEFDPRAKSPAGALGLMQLLPSTASEVAGKLGLPYSDEKLYTKEYNTQLGSAYLAQRIKSFDGSYVLAIASYNAGAGRVRQWINSYGEPRKSVDDVVNWIEKIPYTETRNYVQRVMENLQVYRAILGGDKDPTLEIEQDLKR